MNEKTYPVTLHYDPNKSVGMLKVQGITEAELAKCVIAPSVLVHEDGRLEVVDFSVIPGNSYLPPDMEDVTHA